MKQEIDYYNQISSDIALRLLAFHRIDGRTGTMTDEIYERLYGGTGEIVAEVTEPVAEEVADEKVIEEKEAEKQFIEEIKEQEFPI